MQTVDLSINKKQIEFFNQALLAVTGKSSYRYICLGGSISGGKTYAVLTTFCILCKLYPKSKWVIYRKSFASLQDTTIQSAEKIVGNSSNWIWHRTTSDYHVTYTPTGSEIYFYGENLAADPTLNAPKGMECSGAFLEQAEELSELLFTTMLGRIGRWKIDNKIPNPVIFLTVNPTQNFVKNLFYTPFAKGELKAPFLFIPTLPTDNPTNSEEQFKAYEFMDERSYKQLVLGDWTNFIDKNNLFAFSFNREKHVANEATLDPAIWNGNKNEILYLSFDFNVNPLCCAVIQNYNDSIYVLEQIKLENSNTYRMCDYILQHYPGFLYMVTGDYAGTKRDTAVQDDINNYTIIQQQLRMNNNQFKLVSNPRIEQNQTLVNSILANYPSIQIHPAKGKGLIFDFENVKVDISKKIIKSDRSDPTQQSDSLDCWRYFCNTFLSKFLKLPQTSSLS
jgi:hypothetical protein